MVAFRLRALDCGPKPGVRLMEWGPPARRPAPSCMSPRTILRASQSVNPAFERYLPLLLSFGVVDAAPELGVPDGDALDDDVLVPDDAGGVPELDDEAPVPLDDDDVSGVVDVEPDIDPLGVVDVDGGVVDDDDEVDGDGVTTGGVVPVVVDDSRLQPAIPRTSPVQSNVTSALFIAISR